MSTNLFCFVGGIVMTNDGGMRQRGIEAGLPVVTPAEAA